MTEQELQTIEARHAAATEGPWEYDDIPYNGMDDPTIHAKTITVEGKTDTIYIAQTVYDMQSGTQEHDVDADTIFIGHSWQDVKDLLAYTRSLEMALEQIPGILNNPGPSYIQDVLDLVENTLAQ